VEPTRSDVVVGIASLNDAATIGPLARVIGEALCHMGPSTCIVLADGGSVDGTVETAVQAAGSCVPIVRARIDIGQIDQSRLPYHGLIGRPSALRTIFEAALARDAKACALFDASVTSATPAWVSFLIDPVAKGSSDYVSPCYARHAEEGVITKGIVYPLFRALYGSRVRQPAAGEFGCSAQFMRDALGQAIWEGEDADTAIDIRLITAAVVDKLRISEAELGPRTYKPRTGTPDLATTLAQVVGAIFADMEARAPVWQRVRGSTPVTAAGNAPPYESDDHLVDIDASIDAFRLGCRALRDVWAWVLPPRIILQLEKIATLPTDRVELTDELWAHIVYDFALAYRARLMPRDHLLGSLAPLYLGYLAGFSRQVRLGAPDEIDKRIERVCMEFETQKPHLISGWRWPERFRS
jgi:glucosylglycerate synthase